MNPRTPSLLLLAILGAACARPPHATEPAHGHAHGHGPQQPLVHRFERAEDWAAEFDAADRDAWQKPEHVVALMQIEPGMSVADVGTGTGYFLPHLSRAVGESGRVLALDVEPDMVRYVRARAANEGLLNVRAHECAVDDPGLEAGSVDRILIVDTLHHIPERNAYVQKLARALKPGGRVVVVDFNPTSKRGPPVRHRVPEQQVVHELEAGGLEASIAPSELSEQYVVVGTLR